ncbi:MAG: super-infection exclusion protein B [Anaerolineae bacterium]
MKEIDKGTLVVQLLAFVWGLPTVALLIIALCLALILYLPIVNFESILYIRSHLFIYLEIILLCLVVLIITKCFSQVLVVVSGTVDSAMKQRHLRSYIARLDEGQKAILREFFLQKQNVINLPVDNPAVKGRY